MLVPLPVRVVCHLTPFERSPTASGRRFLPCLPGAPTTLLGHHRPLGRRRRGDRGFCRSCGGAEIGSDLALRSSHWCFVEKLKAQDSSSARLPLMSATIERRVDMSRIEGRFTNGGPAPRVFEASWYIG